MSCGSPGEYRESDRSNRVSLSCNDGLPELAQRAHLPAGRSGSTQMAIVLLTSVCLRETAHANVLLLIDSLKTKASFHLKSHSHFKLNIRDTVFKLGSAARKRVLGGLWII